MKQMKFSALALVLALILAAAPAAISGAVAAENEILKASSADGKGLLLTSKRGGCSAEVFLTDAKGSSQGVLGNSGFKLAAGKCFIEVSPAAEAVEVRMKGRFGLIPDFHGDDTLFDPTVFKGGLMYVAAENFFIVILEGGKGGVMLAWPPDAKQLPMLVAEGDGAARRFTKARVTFDKKPVFIAILDHENGLFPYKDDIKQEFPNEHKQHKVKWQEIKTDYKFPFQASWWTIFTKKSDNLISGIPSSSRLIWPGGWEKGAWSWNETLGSFPTPTFPKDGEWFLQIVDKMNPGPVVLAFPKAGGGSSVSDVLQDMLGRDIFRKAIDYEGLAKRHVMIPAGEPTVDSTCDGWNGLPGNLKAKNKEKYMYTAQALYNFCSYGIKRVNDYRAGAKAVAKTCEDEAKKNPKLKALAERLKGCAEDFEKFWRKENKSLFKGFAQSPDWQAILGMKADEIAKLELGDPFFKKDYDYAVKVYEDFAEADNAKAMNLTKRPFWTDPGGRTDGLLEGSRILAKALRQEAALAGVNSPEEREFALKVRDAARLMLRLSHYKEGAPGIDSLVR